MDQGTALRTLVVAGLVGAVIAALAIASGRPHEPTVTISSVKAGNVDRKSTRLNSSHIQKSRMPSSA